MGNRLNNKLYFENLLDLQNFIEKENPNNNDYKVEAKTVLVVTKLN